MKVGDLVKFRSLMPGPQGVILSLETLAEGPHPSQPEREVAFVEWADSYTPRGQYQVSILEVVSESR